ncbi:MAG TPA: His/Gly/Thr/Pro-type tRNA ligase C-terminal domain-containing protein, partial [Polyangiaceae bacterium]|nr:His/Gly/Thr/Pro-type tRNA ligase C-terminal domain-containing protein [Polyangiaceae bacterium]
PKALTIAREVRARGVRVECDGRGQSLKSQMRRADSLGMRACIVLGEDELSRGVVQLKDLEKHTQREVSFTEIAEQVRALCTVSAEAGGG